MVHACILCECALSTFRFRGLTVSQMAEDEECDVKEIASGRCGLEMVQASYCQFVLSLAVACCQVLAPSVLTMIAEIVIR